MKLLSTIFSALDVLLPPRRTEAAIRHLNEEALLQLAPPGQPLPYHDEHVRALVWEIKYRKNPFALALAGKFLSEQALALGEESLSSPVLVPVPMHAARRAARGYNQTELLCENIMKASPGSFAYAPRALKRVRNTIPQQGLPKYRRLKNIVGAIEVVDAKDIEGRVCIIVDDVSTTGATAHECKRVLLENGAAEVYILTLAHS